MATLGSSQKDLEITQTADDSLRTKVDRIVDSIVQVEEEKHHFVDILLHCKTQLTFPSAFKENYNILDDGFTAAVPLHDLAGMKIAAVDGSILRESLLGADLIASKSRGVVFRFYTKKSPVVKYYPQEKNENFNLHAIFQNADAGEMEFYANIERLISELEMVSKIIRTEPNLDMMIIDGSLFIPELFNRKENYYVLQYTKRLSDLLIDILDIAERNNTILVGVMKDSTSTDLTTIIGQLISTCSPQEKLLEDFYDFDYRQVLQLFKDYDLFFRFMDAGERSFACRAFPKTGTFIPSTAFEKYLKQKELGLYAYLIKTVPMDVPLKVEFFSRIDAEVASKRVARTASLLNPVSRIMHDYSEPSPQMEAHRRVKISENEFQVLVDIIRQKTGYCSSLLQKRRDRRPF